MLGVVATTAGTGVVASVYFVGLCRRAEGLPVLLPPLRWWEFAAMASGITVVGELVIMDASVHGYFALALAALPALVGLLVCARGLGRSAVRLTT
jgi:hypothetical protein